MGFETDIGYGTFQKDMIKKKSESNYTWNMRNWLQLILGKLHGDNNNTTATMRNQSWTNNERACNLVVVVIWVTPKVLSLNFHTSEF